MGAQVLPLKVLLVSVAAVLVGLVSVTVLGAIAGPVFAKAAYIGMVLMTSTVQTLPLRSQLISAVLAAAGSAAGGFVGRDNVMGLIIVIAIVTICQVWFTRQNVKAIAAVPAIVVFQAFLAPPGNAVAIGIGTIVGAALVIGLAQMARLPILPNTSVSTSTAVVHALFLAAGCSLLLLLGSTWELDRTGWGLLVFCLVFLPGKGSWRDALGYAAAATTGSLMAIGVGALGLAGLTIAVTAIAAVLTVAFVLTQRQTVSVFFLTTAVVLSQSLLTESTSTSLGLQRGGFTLVAVCLALALFPVERYVAAVVEHRGATTVRGSSSAPQGSGTNADVTSGKDEND